MLDAAREAQNFARNKTRDDLEKERMLVLSLVKDIEIIGEAATKVTQETMKEYPEIPWSSIVAMRHRLIHGYYDIDLDRVWDTITSDIPPLISALEGILEKEKDMEE